MPILRYVGAVTVATIFWLTAYVVSKTPDEMGQMADGCKASSVHAPVKASARLLLPDSIWADWRFRTLAAGAALGLFAQIGLLSHLFSLIIPVLGEGLAGLITGLATVSAIAGRTLFGCLKPAGANHRIWAAASYGVQIVGIMVLVMSGFPSVALVVLGVAFFGLGIGNATSLPPLIAQAEFNKEDAARIVVSVIAIAQAS